MFKNSWQILYSLECGHLVEMLKLFQFTVVMLTPPPTDNSIQKGNVKARPLLLSLSRQQVFTLSHTKSIRAVPGYYDWRPKSGLFDWCGLSTGRDAAGGGGGVCSNAVQVFFRQ